MRNTGDSYIHPLSEEIRGFAENIKGNSSGAEEFIKNLLAWFDENVTYSRINRPNYPLQRSDLDLLEMKCGTCGDYSNLIVSCLISLGVPAKYAMIGRDAYGDPQDHICAAAEVEGRWVLIDATLPYRKWFGYDCPHKEYELADPGEFERRMRDIERECEFRALANRIPDFTGLLYAPWIHDEVVYSTDERLDSCFYLISVNRPKDWCLSVIYMSYTREGGRTPVMAAVSPYGEYYAFSVKTPASIWDQNQWGGMVPKDGIPEGSRSEELKRMQANMDKNVIRILRAVRLAPDPDVIID